MTDRLAPLPKAAKAALREVLEPTHEGDRDMLSMLDEIDALHEGVAVQLATIKTVESELAIVRAQRDAALDRERTLALERDSAITEFRDLMVCAAVLIERAGGVVEIRITDAQQLERHRLVRIASAGCVQWAIEERP